MEMIKWNRNVFYTSILVRYKQLNEIIFLLI